MNSLNNKSTSVLPTFDYSTLSSEEKLKTLENEKRLDDIFNRYEPEVGEVLYNQQQVMANHGNGMFQNWYESKGFNRGKVYQYINNYKFLNNIEELSHRDIFVSAPKSLQNEMSKPSANPEINEKVFSGDITTHKDYKEQERLIKQKDLQLKQRDQEIERLKNAPPEVIEKEVVKEKVPHDYNGMKSENQQLSQALTKSQREAREIKERLQHLMNERKEMDEQSKQYEELSKAIQEMEGKMTRGQKRIEAQRDVYDLVSRSKTLLMEITPIPYVIDSEYVRENEYAKRELLNISEQMQKFLDNLHDVLEETNFIEGEIING